MPAGTLYVRLYQDGKNKWVSLGTSVYDIAKIKMAEILGAHHTAWKTDRDAKDGSLTVGQLSEVYLQGVDDNTKNKASSKEYRHNTVKRLFKIFPGLHDMRPAQVTEADLQSRFAKAGPYSAGALNGTIDSTRAIFKLALDRGLITKNPAVGLSKPTVLRKKMTLPSTEQFKALVETIRSSDSSSAQGQGDLIEFLAYSGCRIDEAQKITWDDIDFAKGRIYVAPGKNDHFRYVPMIPAMVDLLQRIQSMPRISRCTAREGDNYVLAVREVYHELPLACDKAGCPRISHHDLRHLFATKCIESAVDIPTTSRFLGHLDGGVLAMRVYGHLRDDHAANMAAKVTF